MLYLLYALTAFLICWFFRLLVRGRLINFFYGLGLLIDVAKDIGCQAWIDLSKLWQRRPRIEDHEDFWHRDC
jgi:hypothetical protein